MISVGTEDRMSEGEINLGDHHMVGSRYSFPLSDQFQSFLAQLIALLTPTLSHPSVLPFPERSVPF